MVVRATRQSCYWRMCSRFKLQAVRLLHSWVMDLWSPGLAPRMGKTAEPCKTAGREGRGPDTPKSLRVATPNCRTSGFWSFRSCSFDTCCFARWPRPARQHDSSFKPRRPSLCTESLNPELQAIPREILASECPTYVLKHRTTCRSFTAGKKNYDSSNNNDIDKVAEAE